LIFDFFSERPSLTFEKNVIVSGDSPRSREGILDFARIVGCFFDDKSYTGYTIVFHVGPEKSAVIRPLKEPFQLLAQNPASQDRHWFGARFSCPVLVGRRLAGARAHGAGTRKDL
jgi:hypothetical protein